MTKIVIDTNVLVSALIQYNNPYLIAEAALTNKRLIVCYSREGGFFREVFEEYSSVLRREKFSKFRDFQTNAFNL